MNIMQNTPENSKGTGVDIHPLDDGGHLGLQLDPAQNSRIGEAGSSFAPVRTSLALLGATAALFGGALLGTGNESEAKNGINCDGVLNANTFVCYLPKESAIRRCVQYAKFPPYEFKARFEQTEKSVEDYTASFRVQDIRNCEQIGVRKISFVRKIREKSADEYVSNSPVVTIKSNLEKNVHKILGKTINCSPSVKGAVVKTELRSTWLPKAGWEVPEGVNSTITRSTKPQRIC